MHFYKILSVGGFVVGWFTRVTADKVITLEELLELIKGVLDVLDLPVRIEVPKDLSRVTAMLNSIQPQRNPS